MGPGPRLTRPRGTVLGSDRGRCLVMGVLNVTPDSFSDGRRYLDRDAAVEHGLRLAASGADIVDVGGESTRPGAARVSQGEELRRVVPVVRDLVDSGVLVSVDTMRAGVAAAAVEAGASVVNDVSGGLADPTMGRVVADLGTPYVAMHWRAHSDRMAEHASYGDVVADVRGELAARVGDLCAAGVDADKIVLDPGLGFAKSADQSWALLRGLDRILDLGFPVLVGASRKSFLARPAELRGEAPPAPDRRDQLTAAVTALVAAQGVACVRVHDVAPSRDAVTVATAWGAQA